MRHSSGSFHRHRLSFNKNRSVSTDSFERLLEGSIELLSRHDELMVQLMNEGIEERK